MQDYARVGISLKAHPVGFVSRQLEMLRFLFTHFINLESTNGQLAKIMGSVLAWQRPGTMDGVCFIAIEDETSYTTRVVF